MMKVCLVLILLLSLCGRSCAFAPPVTGGLALRTKTSHLSVSLSAPTFCKTLRRNTNGVISLRAGAVDPAQAKSLVQSTWKVVEEEVGVEAAGVILFMKLFENEPSVLQLFKFKDDTPLEESPALKRHAAEVVQTVGAAVAGLDDVWALIPVLDALGKKHANYKTKPEHFQAVGEALLYTLEAGLGEKWTPEVAQSWLQTWQTVELVMKPALEKEIESKQSK